jgi:O-antigen ligase
MNCVITQGINDNNYILRKSVFLFVLWELLLITSSFLLGYKIVFIWALAIIFIFLTCFDVKTNLMILIALSMFVDYKNPSTLAFGLGVLTLVLVSMFLTLYFRFCLKGVKIIKSKLNLPLIVFMLIVSFNIFRGMFYSYKASYWALETFAYLSFGLIFLVMNFFRSPEDVRKFFKILILLAIYQSIYGLVNYLLVGHRIGGTIFGVIPSIIAVVLLNLFFYSQNKRKKWLYLLLSLLPIMHLIFSFSRGYWLGFLVALVLSYSFHIYQLKYTIRKRFVMFVRGAAVACIGFLLGLLLLQQFLPGDNLIGSLLNRFQSGFSGSFSRETVSNYLRLLEYEGAIEKIKEKPILGFGIGYGFALRDWVARRTYTVRAVHHDYLAIVLKMGLLGLLSFLWLFYVFFSNGLKIVTRLKDQYLKGLSAGLLATVLQLLLIGFTNHVFIGIMNTFYLAFAVGAVETIGKSGESAKERQHYSNEHHLDS